jgi:hypothetical protein
LFWADKMKIFISLIISAILFMSYSSHYNFLLQDASKSYWWLYCAVLIMHFLFSIDCLMYK